MTHRTDERDEDDEPEPPQGGWRRQLLHWLKWLGYMTALWLVLLPAKRALAESALDGWLADVLLVALAAAVLAVIVFIDRRVVRARD